MTSGIIASGQDTILAGTWVQAAWSLPVRARFMVSFLLLNLLLLALNGQGLLSKLIKPGLSPPQCALLASYPYQSLLDSKHQAFIVTPRGIWPTG